MSVTVASQPPSTAPPKEKELYGELEALCQLVELGQGRFTLALVEYDLPRKCAEVVSEIEEQFSATHPVKVALSPPPPDAPLTYSVLDQLKELVQASSPAPGPPPDVLIITGLETLLPSIEQGDGQISDEVRRAIQPLNLGRNILAEIFPCPVLLCLPKPAMQILLNSAPDIVSWKSGFFTFESDLENVRAEIEREAHVKVGWLERWRLRRLAPDKLLGETKRLAALIADARALPVAPQILARLQNRLGWTAAALGDGSVAQQSFAEMLRLSRDANDAKLISTAEKGLRRAEKLQARGKRSLRHAITQQSFRGAAALSAAEGLFGRETELQELLLQVTRVGTRFVTVWGETGCGKTSLVLAGVVPELEKRNHLSVIFREWEYPTQALRGAIEKACGLSLPSSGSLHSWVQAATQETNKTLVIVCDQFEQFFTKHPRRQEREPLLKEIGACLNDFRLPCKFIFILREDHLGRMVELEKYVGDALDRNKRFYLSLFDQATAFRVMRQLSDKARLNWPDVFLNEVIKDLTQDGQVRPIELQLVGAALATLNINDEQAYSRAGRAEGLLTDYLQATLESLSGTKRELRTMKRVLLTLIEEPHERLSLTAQGIATRSDISLSRVHDALNKLTSVNLVRSRAGQQEQEESEDDAPVSFYELMHDVLVDSVLRLTRDIQDKRRLAKRILTRALEDARVNPRHTVGLREWRFLRKNLPATIRTDTKVESLLNRSLFFGKAQRTTLALLALLLTSIFLQGYLYHVTIEQDFNNRVVIRRGLFQRNFLRWIGNDIIIDTGFTAKDLSSGKTDLVEGIYFWGAASKQSKALGDQRFYESFASPAAQAKLLYITGRKDEAVSRLLRLLKENQAPPYTYEAAKTLATIIESDKSLARPIFDMLFPVFRQGQIDSGTFYVTIVLAAAIKADPSLARPVFEALLPVFREGRSEPVSGITIIWGATIEADPSLAKPAFEVLIPAFKQGRDDSYSYDKVIALASVIKADRSLAKPAFEVLIPAFKQGRNDSYTYERALAFAVIIKAERSLARPIFEALLPALRQGSSLFRYDVGTTFAAAIKADPSLARPIFQTLSLFLRQDEDTFWHSDLSVAFAAVTKADPSLARPIFQTLLSRFEKAKDSFYRYRVTIAMAAAVRADPSLAKLAFASLTAILRRDQNNEVFYGTERVLGNSIAIDKEVRIIASHLFTDDNPTIRLGVSEGYAKYLAALAEEEVGNGRDPVQFLFDHLEGKKSLMPDGNANTYAIYRQAVQGAMAWWMVSKKPEAVATQAMLKQRLETMRDQDERLHLRVAAWDALAAAANLRDQQDSDEFEDFDE